MTLIAGYWYCVPCGTNNGPQRAFCTVCGRSREDGSDKARWERFFSIDAVVMSCDHEWEVDYPTRECLLCGLIDEAPEPIYDEGDV